MQSNRVSWGGVGVWALVVTAGLALNAGALAQSDDDALGGPKVKDNSVQGERRTLTGKGDEKFARAGRLPPRTFERAMGVLHADDAPENLRLTDTQEGQIKNIREEFLGQMRDYIAEHKDEVQQLREKLPARERGRVDQFLGGGRGPGGPGGPEGERRPRGKGDGKGERPGKGGPDGAPPPPPRDSDAMQGDEPMVDAGETEAAKARLKELIDGAPKPADAHARVMAVLTEAQREAVNKEVERLQKEAADRGREAPKGEPGAGGGPREEFLKNLTPEEREKLKNMSPEERREFVKNKARKNGK